MKLGVALPLSDIGGEPATVRLFAQAAEVAGYDHLAAPDHVLGSMSRADLIGARKTPRRSLPRPFRPVRVSQQLHGANRFLDTSAHPSSATNGGRFRLGVGVGWNEAEFVGLNEDFHNRGRRSEEQVQVMQALWAKRHVNFKGQWHPIDDAGINPLPIGRRVPIWFGGIMI